MISAVDELLDVVHQINSVLVLQLILVTYVLTYLNQLVQMDLLNDVVGLVKSLQELLQLYQIIDQPLATHLKHPDLNKNAVN